MRREQGRGDSYRQLLAEPACHTQHLQLVGGRQAVSGLDLHGGYAIGQQCLQPWQALRQQLLLAGGAGGAHGAEDATAGLGDFSVVDPFQALLELVGAVAGIDQMTVAIDQTGRHHATATHFQCAGDLRLIQFGHGHHERDATGLDHHRHRLGQCLRAVE